MRERIENAKKFDKFFTLPEVAKSCINFIKNTVNTRGISLWIEPSAGAGAFLDQLPLNSIGLDIDPHSGEGNRIQKTDFLDWEYPDQKNIITVGNPPFGKNSALAVRFFNHAAKSSSIIAFIVPKTFKKDSLKNRLDDNFHLIGELPIASNSFTFLEQIYDVPCVFQVWEKRAYKRKLIKQKTKTNDFQFVKREEADFAFQRVGARAGKIYSAPDQFYWRSPSSHYFIKDCTPDKRVSEVLLNIFWDEIKFQTAGNPSIAKSELIREYEAIAA